MILVDKTAIRIPIYTSQFRTLYHRLFFYTQAGIKYDKNGNDHEQTFKIDTICNTSNGYNERERSNGYSAKFE